MFRNKLNSRFIEKTEIKIEQPCGLKWYFIQKFIMKMNLLNIEIRKIKIVFRPNNKW